MKNSTLLLLLCVFFVSCTKENLTSPVATATINAAGSDDATAQTSVTFNANISGSVFLTVYMSKLVYTISGTKPTLSYFKLYLDGGQVPASVSYYNDTITVVAKRIIPIVPGNHNYTLMAKTTGTKGSSFSITLNNAVLANNKRLFVAAYNLPVAGNTFTFN